MRATNSGIVFRWPPPGSTAGKEWSARPAWPSLRSTDFGDRDRPTARAPGASNAAPRQRPRNRAGAGRTERAIDLVSDRLALSARRNDTLHRHQPVGVAGGPARLRRGPGSISRSQTMEAGSCGRPPRAFRSGARTRPLGGDDRIFPARDDGAVAGRPRLGCAVADESARWASIAHRCRGGGNLGPDIRGVLLSW